MNKLRPIQTRTDIPETFRETPIGLLLEYHNLGKPYDVYSNAQLLIGMCMDSRKHLHIPDNFAFILRSGGANLRPAEFKVSYAIAVGGVRAIALIGHNRCGMVNLVARREAFVNGLIEGAGWDRVRAEEHFLSFAPIFEIGNEIEFIISEAERLSRKYPKIIIAPLMFNVDDGLISWIERE